MDDYISKTEALDIVRFECGEWSGLAKTIGKRFDDLPHADVQPVRHGRWIGISYDGYDDGNPVFYEWKCSECGKIVVADDANELNYCCNCGARMEGEQNG